MFESICGNIQLPLDYVVNSFTLLVLNQYVTIDVTLTALKINAVQKAIKLIKLLESFAAMSFRSTLPHSKLNEHIEQTNVCARLLNLFLRALPLRLQCGVR